MVVAVPSLRNLSIPLGEGELYMNVILVIYHYTKNFTHVLDVLWQKQCPEVLGWGINRRINGRINSYLGNAQNPT